MWLLLLVTAGIAGCTSATLEGDHVCQQEERYTVNVTRSILRTVKIRNYKWCMSVPPRCSYYTDEEKYIPETTEEEDIRLVNKCCPGYVKDETGEKCISQCSNCIHGECEVNNKCNCHPGFWGDGCDKACSAKRWGRNCEFECLCTKGDCDQVTGYCICPPGWKGTRCEEWILNNGVALQNSKTTTAPIWTTTPTFATTTANNKATSSSANLEQRLKKYSERTKYPVFQKYYSFYMTTTPQNPQATTKFKSDPLNEVGNWQPPQINAITEKNVRANSSPKSTWLPIENTDETTIHNHIEPSTKIEKQRNGDLAEVNTTPVAAEHVTTVTPREDDKDKQEQEFVNSKITDQVVWVTQPNHANLKAKVVDGLEISVTSTPQTVFLKEEDWLNDDESRVGLPIHQNPTPINDSHLVFSVGAAAGVTATIILIVAVALLTTQRYRRKKPAPIVAVTTKSKNDNGDAGVPAVSIYARSVFHAPLPDPPVFENPIFTAPMEYENSPNEFGGTLETRVICSMHLPTHSSYRRDSRVVDAFYDHPPSTGSYRAASIPEPPEQTLEISSGELKEHLYDEIPCWKQPQPIMQPPQANASPESLSYYANTRM